MYYISFFIPHIHSSSLLDADPGLFPPFCQVVIRAHSTFQYYTKQVASFQVATSVLCGLVWL